MLKGISPLLSPDLLRALCQMGHGDEIVLADAHFPGESLGRRVLRADGLPVPPLLDAMAPLFELDTPGAPLTMMQTARPEELDRALEAEYMAAVRRHAPAVAEPVRVPREAFYRQAQAAFAVLLTGETRPYGNIILRKGVTPLPTSSITLSGVSQ